MFVGSPILAQLMSYGLMDDIREVLEKSEPSWRAANSVDSEFQSLIHLVVAQGQPNLVQLLLEFEPDVEAQSRSGSTPLERSESSTWGSIHLAAGGGHIEKTAREFERERAQFVRAREKDRDPTNNTPILDGFSKRVYAV